MALILELPHTQAELWVCADPIQTVREPRAGLVTVVNGTGLEGWNSDDLLRTALCDSGARELEAIRRRLHTKSGWADRELKAYCAGSRGLPVACVIHVVFPLPGQDTVAAQKQVFHACRNVLLAAQRRGLRSIALPIIGWDGAGLSLPTAPLVRAMIISINKYSYPEPGEVFLCPHTHDVSAALQGTIWEMLRTRNYHDGNKEDVLQRALRCLSALPPPQALGRGDGDAQGDLPAGSGDGKDQYPGILPHQTRGPRATISGVPDPAKAADERGVMHNQVGPWWWIVPRFPPLPSIANGTDLTRMSHADLLMLTRYTTTLGPEVHETWVHFTRERGKAHIPIQHWPREDLIAFLISTYQSKYWHPERHMDKVPSFAGYQYELANLVTHVRRTTGNRATVSNEWSLHLWKWGVESLGSDPHRHATGMLDDFLHTLMNAEQEDHVNTYPGWRWPGANMRNGQSPL